MRRGRTAVLLLLGFGVAHAANRAQSIQSELSRDDYEGARKKCERWEATSPDADVALKEVCAKAHWPLAEAEDSAAGWKRYRKIWVGTDWAEVAFEREGTAALRDLGEASEDAFLEIVRMYADTRSAEDAAVMAADAAVRDADSGDAAARAAVRYPGHPGLPALVERYPEHFVQVAITGHEVAVTVDPPVELPPYMEPKVAWVAGWPGGHTQPWAEVVQQHLQTEGLPAEKLQPSPQGPGFPLCALPGKPEGFHAAAEIRLGAGVVLRPTGWDEGCGPQDWPAVIAVASGRVTGISLAPGVGASLGTREWAGREQARAFADNASGDTILSGDLAYVPTGRVYVVYPHDGGAPWMTDRAPARETVVVLSGAMTGSGPPPGWSLATVDDTLVLQSADILEQPPWLLPPGEIRFLSPVTQKVLGIVRPTTAAPSGAPALSAVVPWSRGSDGYVRAEPPEGGQAVVLPQADAATLQTVGLRIVSAGITLADLEVLDGWTLDLDGDGEDEHLLRAKIRGRSAVLVLDVHPQLGNRLFVTATEHATRGTMPAPPPFAFRYGGHLYIAWTGTASAKASYVEVVRASGASVTVEGFEVARP